MAAGDIIVEAGPSDSDEKEEEDAVKIVLHQPEEWDEDEMGEDMGEDAAEYAEHDAQELLEGAEEGLGDGANGSEGASTSGAAGTPARASASKSAFSKATPASKTKSEAGGGAATTTKGGKATKAETAKTLAALKAKLGPVANMPGGLLMNLELTPENLDLDSIQDPGWKRPDADPTDYFNYGFNEETWRFYCQRQKVCGHKPVFARPAPRMRQPGWASSLTWSAALHRVRRSCDRRFSRSPGLQRRRRRHRTPLAWPRRRAHRRLDQWQRCIWELRRAWAAAWVSL
jgi:hypothetical protein